MVNTTPNAKTPQAGGSRNKPANSTHARTAAVSIRVLSIRCLKHRLLPASWAEVLPKRRSRCAKCSNAASRCAGENSGHSASVEIQLRIGKIPQQEIADPLLAARADQQIGIGNAGQRQPLRNLRLVDIGCGQQAARRRIVRRATRQACAISHRPP